MPTTLKRGTQKILTRTKELLLDEGWAQGSKESYDAEGAVTGLRLTRAMALAAKEYGYKAKCRKVDSNRFIDQAVNALLNATGQSPYGFDTVGSARAEALIGWNDSMFRSQADVIAAIEVALS